MIPLQPHGQHQFGVNFANNNNCCIGGGGNTTTTTPVTPTFFAPAGIRSDSSCGRTSTTPFPNCSPAAATAAAFMASNYNNLNQHLLQSMAIKSEANSVKMEAEQDVLMIHQNHQQQNYYNLPHGSALMSAASSSVQQQQEGSSTTSTELQNLQRAVEKHLKLDYGSAATEVKADPAKPFIKTPANQYPPASSFGMYAPFQWQQNGFEFFPSNPVSNGFISESGTKKGGSRRLTYTKECTGILEGTFLKNEYLNKAQRQELIERIRAYGKMDLNDQQIKVWFQNRRMKKKKKNPEKVVNNGSMEEQSQQSTPPEGGPSEGSIEAAEKCRENDDLTSEHNSEQHQTQLPDPIYNETSLLGNATNNTAFSAPYYGYSHYMGYYNNYPYYYMQQNFNEGCFGVN